ncbi:MAG: hypothetical protein JXQ73_08235 [Phycisphaerae bacterium]|nr:hypothetical protein [Phycisphaerae bacterium]
MTKCLLLVSAMLLIAVQRLSADDRIMPVIEAPWWQVAGNPDLGRYTSKDQQPVDFGVWQADDGTWQLWSCIRHTQCGGHTRLFHRWEGRKITDSDWKPMGIAMEADPSLGEDRGGLQAPHVVKHDGLYWMAYGDWNHICFATSQGGKTFKRIVQPDGKTGAFGEGPGANTRDAMLIKIGGLWHCYYTALPNQKGYGFCRTSPDLRTWSPSCVASYGGQVGPNPWWNECPHVVEVLPGEFVYFRNQFYGQGAKNWVYSSRNPLNFGIDDDTHLVCPLPIAAPEIVHHDGKYYIAVLNPGLDGIRIARLRWARVKGVGRAVFDFDDEAARKQWRIVEGDLPDVFSTSTRQHFAPPQKHFIATAELPDGKFDDARTGVIESPEFTLEHESYYVYVSGGSDQDKTYVAVVEADGGKEIVRLAGRDWNTLERKLLDVTGHRGKRVRVRVVDKATGPWGHVNFGGIFEMPEPVPIP